jgi:putative ABC transport system ATP-binding protein
MTRSSAAELDLAPPASAIVCENLIHIYRAGDLEVVALQGLDLLVQSGEMVAVVGPSGSGKSTLLHILAGFEPPSAGLVTVAGHDLGRLTPWQRTNYRRRVVGFIWQQTARNLLPYLSAIENVELPMKLDSRHGTADRARELLARVGLGNRLDHSPERLSGGEQQRVAIAIALANDPAVLLADEPTGELDSTTSNEILDLLRSFNSEFGTTIVMVTHDPLMADHVDRTIAIRDGRTSTEVVRRVEHDEQGARRVVDDEFAVLDRTGRLQLPRGYIESLGLRRRVRLHLGPEQITIEPDTSMYRKSTRRGG